MTQRIPKSSSAHGACSRDEPQPKLWAATKICAPLYAGLLSTKSGFSEPSSLYRRSLKRFLPKPVFFIVFKNRAGIIRSVSQLTISMGAATAVKVLNFSIFLLPYFISSRTSAKRPSMAAATAMGGLTKWVRPPGPWRPWKLRLEVDADRSPGSS